MATQRLQKGDEYTKKLVRFTPENCALIQEWADASHLSFNAALNEYLRASRLPEPRRTRERQARRQPSAPFIRGEVIAGQ